MKKKEKKAPEKFDPHAFVEAKRAWIKKAAENVRSCNTQFGDDALLDEVIGYLRTGLWRPTVVNGGALEQPTDPAINAAIKAVLAEGGAS